MKAVALLLSLFALASGLARAETQTLKFYGYAYDLKTGKYIYTEVYHATIDGERWTGGTISYFGPDGKRLGGKTLDFSVNPYIPLYSMDLPSAGYQEGITQIRDNGIDVFKVTREKGRQTVTIARTEPMAADSGFHSYLRDHMAELVDGKVLKFRFAAAGQLDSYNFRAMKIGDTQFEGKPAIQVKVEPDSVIRFMTPPLVLTYDPTLKRLLEYRGTSNVISAETGKAYDVHIAFYSQPPADAPKDLPPLE